MSFHAPLAHPGWMNRTKRFPFSHEWEKVPEGRMRAGARSATGQLVLGSEGRAAHPDRPTEIGG
jgi:hypothetical protein